MSGEITFAPGAEDNGLAGMLGTLVETNLKEHPDKLADFDSIKGIVAVVADDADVAVTLEFARGRLTLHDGVWGIPDITLRGPSDAIIALSNVPATTRYKLPIPRRSDREGALAMRTIFTAFREKKLRVYGAVFNMPLMLKFGHVLSVN